MRYARKEELAEGVTDDRWVTIYALCQPIGRWQTGPVRYVGKTVRYVWHRVRHHASLAQRGSSLPVHRWLKKQIDADLPFHIKHLERIRPGDDWASRERHWIEHYRRDGHLLNLTDGGEGLAGHRFTDDHKQKIAASLRTGEWFACEVCTAPFWRKQKDIRQGNCRFCSRACYQQWQRGKSKGGKHVS